MKVTDLQVSWLEGLFCSDACIYGQENLFLLSQLLLERRIQCGDDHKQIADDAVAGLFEDGRIGVFVDSDDHLGRTNAREVLDRTGNTAGDIEIRRNDFAGLTNLIGVGDVARVHCGA